MICWWNLLLVVSSCGHLGGMFTRPKVNCHLSNQHFSCLNIYIRPIECSILNITCEEVGKQKAGGYLYTGSVVGMGNKGSIYYIYTYYIWKSQRKKNKGGILFYCVTSFNEISIKIRGPSPSASLLEISSSLIPPYMYLRFSLSLFSTFLSSHYIHPLSIISAHRCPTIIHASTRPVLIPPLGSTEASATRSPRINRGEGEVQRESEGVDDDKANLDALHKHHLLLHHHHHHHHWP